MYQESIMWNPFWSTSSRNILNLLCMYCDVICGFDMMFWTFHWYSCGKPVGCLAGIRASKSGHFVSAALMVKKNVGVPCWLIIFVSSALLLFQYEGVPHNEDPNLATLSPIFSLGMSSNWLTSSSIVGGSVSSRFFLTKIEAVVLLQWHIITLYI